MVFVTRNPLWWLVGTLISLAIAAVRQADDAIHSVQPQINHAQKVADCIQNAGTDLDKIAACNR